MRLGVGFLPESMPAGLSASAGYDMLLRLACRADEIGFEHVQFTDVDNRREPDPVPFLSAVSALTVGIRVVAALAVPDRNRVRVVADRLAALDHLSHGRLDVAFHPADRRARPDGARTSSRVNRACVSDGVDSCRRYWTGPDTDQSPVPLPPYQRPHPPVFLVCATSAAQCFAAGRVGHQLQAVAATAGTQLREMLAAYRAGRAEAGLAPGRIRLVYDCHLAEDDDAALSAARRSTTSGSQSGWRAAQDGVLAGDSARVCDELAEIAGRFGEDVSLQVRLARVPGVGLEQLLDLFAAQVMPSFSSEPEDAHPGG